VTGRGIISHSIPTSERGSGLPDRQRRPRFCRCYSDSLDGDNFARNDDNEMGSEIRLGCGAPREADDLI